MWLPTRAGFIEFMRIAARLPMFLPLRQVAIPVIRLPLAPLCYGSCPRSAYLAAWGTFADHCANLVGVRSVCGSMPFCFAALRLGYHPGSTEICAWTLS
jgi:hypothetical protein